MKRSLLPSCLLGLLCLAGRESRAGEKIQPPAGGLRMSQWSDMKAHPSSSNTYNEFWTYQLFLEGNVQASLNFSRVNLGAIKSPVCGADLTLLGFRGKNYSVAREYDKKNFQFIDSSQQLRVHENIWFRGRLPEEHHIHFATSKKGTSYYLDLHFTGITPGKVWGDGMFRFGSSHTVGIFMHIPYARVSGKVAINGDTVQVTGTAYMDHTFQTALAPELVGSGFRYVSQTGPLEAGYFMVPVSRYEGSLVGYGLRDTASGLCLLKSANGLNVAATSKAMGVKVPTRMEIPFQDGGKSLLERSQDRLQQSYLHEFSGLTKLAIKRFMGGEILNFRGLGILNGTQPMVYNYFIVD